jgi:hypothetical protein
VARRVNWLLDADIRDFFTNLDHRWLQKFEKGDIVRHAKWGEGEVVRVVGDSIYTFFPVHGEKLLKAHFLEKGQRVARDCTVIDTPRLFSPVLPSNTFTPPRSEANFTAYGIRVGASGSGIASRTPYVPAGGGAAVTEIWVVVPGTQLLVAPADRS